MARTPRPKNPPIDPAAQKKPKRVYIPDGDFEQTTRIRCGGGYRVIRKAIGDGR